MKLLNFQPELKLSKHLVSIALQGDRQQLEPVFQKLFHPDSVVSFDSPPTTNTSKRGQITCEASKISSFPSSFDQNALPKDVVPSMTVHKVTEGLSEAQHPTDPSWLSDTNLKLNACNPSTINDPPQPRKLATSVSCRITEPTKNRVSQLDKITGISKSTREQSISPIGPRTPILSAIQLVSTAKEKRKTNTFLDKVKPEISRVGAPIHRRIVKRKLVVEFEEKSLKRKSFKGTSVGAETKAACQYATVKNSNPRRTSERMDAKTALSSTKTGRSKADLAMISSAPNITKATNDAHLGTKDNVSLQRSSERVEKSKVSGKNSSKQNKGVSSKSKMEASAKIAKAPKSSLTNVNISEKPSTSSRKFPKTDNLDNEGSVLQSLPSRATLSKDSSVGNPGDCSPTSENGIPLKLLDLKKDLVHGTNDSQVRQKSPESSGANDIETDSDEDSSDLDKDLESILNQPASASSSDSWNSEITIRPIPQSGKESSSRKVQEVQDKVRSKKSEAVGEESQKLAVNALASILEEKTSKLQKQIACLTVKSL